MSIHEIFSQNVRELEDRTDMVTEMARTDIGAILIQPVFSNQGTGNYTVFTRHKLL